MARYREAEARLWREYRVSATERFVSLGAPKSTLRVLEAGPADGDPLVFLGGTGGTGPYWAALVSELDQHRCLLVDRPGWGLSTPIDWRGQQYQETVVGLLDGVMDAMDLPRAAFVGASIGAVWALRMAQHRPDRVSAVIMLGPGPLVDDVSPPAFIRLLASPLGALIVRLPQNAKRVRSILRQIGHGTSLDAGRVPDAFVEWRVSFERETGALRHERMMVRSLLRNGRWAEGLTFSDAELQGIAQPALLVYGARDDVGTTATWRRFTDTLPHGRLELIEDGGHVPWLDDPQRVAAAVRQTLRAAD